MSTTTHAHSARFHRRGRCAAPTTVAATAKARYLVVGKSAATSVVPAAVRSASIAATSRSPSHAVSRLDRRSSATVEASHSISSSIQRRLHNTTARASERDEGRDDLGGTEHGLLDRVRNPADGVDDVVLDARDGALGEGRSEQADRTNTDPDQQSDEVARGPSLPSGRRWEQPDPGDPGASGSATVSLTPPERHPGTGSGARRWTARRRRRSRTRPTRRSERHGGSLQQPETNRLAQRLADALPIVRWLPAYPRRLLRGDVLAGSDGRGAA